MHGLIQPEAVTLLIMRILQKGGSVLLRQVAVLRTGTEKIS
jgi:hypothetical protein